MRAFDLKGRVAVVTGGTGLYFKALTQGLSAVPPTPPDIRASVRTRIEAQGAPALYAELARREGVSGVAEKAGRPLTFSPSEGLGS